MQHRKINKVDHKVKKGISAIIFSRFFVFFLFVAIQVAIFAFGVYFAFAFKPLQYVIVAIQIFLIIFIINDKSDPTMKIVWVVLLLVLPTLGTLTYLYFRLQPASKKLKKRLKHINEKSKRYLEQDPEVYNELAYQDGQVATLSRYIDVNSLCPIYRNTDVTYLSCGEEMYQPLIEKLEEAKDYIFIEYFIIEQGKVWDSILRVLEKKVQQGVEVRIMYDGFCTFSRVEIGYYKKLIEKGIKAKPYAPVRPFLTTSQNNRDHRKIIAIDGKVAFTGGINLADEYFNVKEMFGYWKDNAVMLEGDAAKTLTLLFLQMWNVDEKTIGNFDRYLDVSLPDVYDNGFVTCYGDDPYNDEQIGEAIYLHLINTSKKYVHIVTPYLVIDNVMVEALKFAAKRGVEVILMMPGIPDKWYAYCLARTYYKELIEAGVEIREYTPGFTHAKMFVVDDDKAVVGTTNLDYRSLFLHFEDGCFMYKSKAITDMEADYQEMIANSKRVTLIGCKNRPLYYKVAGKLLRIIAPIM